MVRQVRVGVRCLRAGENMAISNWMRFGDGAAVALIGWILMAPSIDCARQGLQRQTPLSEWEQVDSFSSRESCENYRGIVIAAEKTDSDNAVERYSYSICVQADDPRLKGE
jgi:hypothetical protein